MYPNHTKNDIQQIVTLKIQQLTYFSDNIIEQGSAQANDAILNPDSAHATSSSSSVLDRTGIGTPNN